MATRPGYIWSGTEWVAIGQEAVLAPISYQTSAPSSPATGDVWIDSNDDVPSVNSTLYYRWKKTATGGETSFTGTDDNSLTLAYTAGYESVFINGVLQVRGSDYTATTGTSITGLTALTAGDIVMVESVMAYSVGDTYTQSQMTSLLGGKSDVSTTGLVLVATSDFTSAATVQINNCFTSSYKNYHIEFNYTLASGFQVPYLQLSASGTAKTSNYAYYGVWVDEASGPSRTSASGQSNWALGYSGDTINNITMNVYSPQLSAPTSINHVLFGRGSSGQTRFHTHAGYQTENYQADGIYFYNGGSTNMTGTIKVYGYK
jgi:hypothetical protein